MSALEYGVGLVLVLAALAAVAVTPFLLVHSRTAHDHGPACWWCHPRLTPRKRH
ncbi:hypothetical protein [Streptomyces sp. NPDC058595]|uniref:hypothetical protein n=1 Tax=Streptomyces sp. NPDC058595 TaxID=3346550 RepID=UPI0036462CB1